MATTFSVAPPVDEPGEPDTPVHRHSMAEILRPDYQQYIQQLIAESPLQLSNTEAAFRYKTTGELNRSHLLFSSIQSQFLVRMGPKMVDLALRLHLPIQGLLRTYFFNQFCGGETLQQALKTADRLAHYGVMATLDYGVEAEKTERGYQLCVNNILQAIEAAAEHASVTFVAIKVTGFGSADVLAAIQKGNREPLLLLQFERIRHRLGLICQRAAQRGQPIMIDAEETWTQDVVDRLCEEQMALHNKVRPIVFTTVQMYRTGRLDYIEDLFEQSRNQGFIPAIKLVRGAYMEKESRVAREQGRANPIQPNKEATDREYNTALVFITQRIDRMALCLGTHNEDSCRLLAAFMEKQKLAADHPHVTVSQLYGMSDNISFNVAAAGYRVAKYLPYGPLHSVMPYLFRRAEENSSIAGQTGRELTLIRHELTRRRKAKSS